MEELMITTKSGKEIHVFRTEVSYSELKRYIDFVVNCSFDVNGHYHAYLNDYAETLATLTIYTDYKIESVEDDGNDEISDFDKSFNEIMEIRNNETWKRDILPKFGSTYKDFCYYAEREIEMATRPLYSVNEAIVAITNLAKEVNGVLQSIDFEKLQNADFSQLISAVEKLNEVSEAK